MKLITKIRKASFPHKTELWYNANLSLDEAMQLVQDMIFSLPKGHYKVHDRQYGNNIVDAIYNMYGWMPSMWIDEATMLGLQYLYPKRVYVTFTHGLDVVHLK